MARLRKPWPVSQALAQCLAQRLAQRFARRSVELAELQLAALRPAARRLPTLRPDAQRRWQRERAATATLAIGLSASSGGSAGKSGKAASGTYPSVPLAVRIFTKPFTRERISTVSPHFSRVSTSKLLSDS